MRRMRNCEDFWAYRKDRSVLENGRRKERESDADGG